MPLFPTLCPPRRHSLPLGLALAIALAACGHRPATSDEFTSAIGDTETLVFEPMLIRVSLDGDESDSRADSLWDLFDEANDYLIAESWDHALELYRLIAANALPGGELQRSAIYNAGLTYEGLNQSAHAAEQYRRVLRDWPDTRDAIDASFRLALCEADLGNHRAIPPLMTRVIESGELSVEEECEAWLRLGNARIELEEYPEAIEAIRQALSRNDNALLYWNPETSAPTEEPLQGSHPILSHLHFSLGKVYHRLFSSIRLVLPQEQLTQDLVDKTQLFGQAQDSYLDTVRTGNRYWSPAAGFMVGQLFEDYYFDVLATEVPDDFDDLELEVYFEELRVYIRPAMERAKAIYENNLAMAYRLGSDNEWVDQTLESILRVHRYLEEQPDWEDEHRLIVEGRHSHSAPAELRRAPPRPAQPAAQVDPSAIH